MGSDENRRHYPSLTQHQLEAIQQKMEGGDGYYDVPDQNNQRNSLHVYDNVGAAGSSKGQGQQKPTVLQIDRLNSETLGGSPFVFKGALIKKKPGVERQQSRVGKLQHSISVQVRSHSSLIKNIILGLLFLGYTAYFICALMYSLDGATALIVLTSITVFGIIYSFISNRYGETIYTNFIKPIEDFLHRQWVWAQWILIPLLFCGFIWYLAFYVIEEVRQLQSISGNVVFIAILYLTSKHPNQIKWRPVIWGFTLQFIIGILVLRWQPGYNAVQWLSDEIMKFMYYALEGAAVVFGDPMLILHSFVFVSMPMLIYVGAVMSILYYLGVTQVVATKLGWIVQKTMGTTAIESLGVAGNIFLNGMDVMLMLKSYIPRLTKSEFFCFLVGNHSTVAGFAFPLFVMFGAPPEYLLSAAVMSAPAAIAVSKINYPETEESITQDAEDIEFERPPETNITEAAANGSAVAGKTAMSVVVSYIAFLGLLGFINATLAWFGNQVGVDDLSFQLICSYLFYPLSILMGVDTSEAREVGKLVGIKVFATELLAFEELGNSIRNGLSDRSASIVTYSLSGFSSLSTLAISVGVWQALIPDKVHDMTSNMIRAVACANLSCFMTACVAALLFDQSLIPPKGDPDPFLSFVAAIFELIPGYKDILGLLPGYNF